ncbi:tetratricopeptide repeat protein [Ferruginibacter yonginensis]|uniref:Tetratricopeptide repeat protein n=1 Tax=Ferruginibacter yonginensis TaxID=1310416 RepID=A0ABV8QVT8_9BACT
MVKKIVSSFFAVILVSTTFAQGTHVITDEEKDYKTAKEFIAKEQYAFAYPLIKQLKADYPANRKSDHAYINDDIDYYYALCELKLLQDIGRVDAEEYINAVNNEPRRQLMSFNLAHYYFLKNEYQKAIDNFDAAGYNNLSNEQIADAKFEKAYAYFNLKQFAAAKPLFDEIHQLPANKYYIPANYYYGFISYYDRQYNEALKSFKLVETFDEYKGVVPYYIAEIYYFQGKKDDALRYGESVLQRKAPLYYDAQLRLLIGQIYFEKKEYDKALPLLENYVNNNSKVSKEVLYELSFCYYVAGNTRKAIDGFKQLSNERDSMGQNSMYLLGDLYLKTGEKANARTAFQYSAFNSSNDLQQRVSAFNYAKLSYELGYQDVALNEIKNYLKNYPNSNYDIEAKEILVALLARTNNFTDALAVYQSLGKPTLAMQKNYPTLLYGKAIELVNDQQIIRADELFAKVIADANAGKTALYANFWRGEIAYRQQQYDAAIRFLTIFIQGNVPAQGEANTTTARYNVAYSYFQKENYKQAATAFEQVAQNITINSTALEQDAYLRCADAYYMQKEYSKANAMYEAAIKASSTQSDYALYQRAMIAGIKNSNDKIALLNTVNKQYPKSTLKQDINMEIALTYIADEKFADAIPYLNTIINSADGGLKPKAYLKLGLANYNNKNNSEALKAYTQLIKLYPASAEADEALDIVKSIYVDEGKPEEYIAIMKANGKSVAMSEADSLSYAAAFNKYELGDCNVATTSFTNYLNKYPAGAFVLDALYLRADCYQRNKDITNAFAGYAAVSDKGNSKYFEKATLEAARLAYFEIKNYADAKKYFEVLRTNSVNQDNQLEALRGLVRSYYQLKDYAQANTASKELLTRKGISTDDKSIANLVLGKSLQINNDAAGAITAFKAVIAINRSAWGAEARYELASVYFKQNNLAAAEKAALATIKETGSYDEWVTSSYILLGDIFMQQKDYFNAKATYESVAKNAAIPALKAQAAQKLEAAIAAEKAQSKISN